MMNPDIKTVESATSLIKRVLKGEKLSSEDIAAHNDIVTCQKEWMENLKNRENFGFLFLINNAIELSILIIFHINY